MVTSHIPSRSVLPASSITYWAARHCTEEMQASCHPQYSESKGRAMMAADPVLLKAQHFAEDEAPGSTYQPLRTSTLRTELEMQRQIANPARRASFERSS